MTCRWHPPGASCGRRVAGYVRIGKFAGLVCHRHLQRLQFLSLMLRRRMTFEAVG